MERKPIQLHIGGQSYKVVSSASEEELARLGAVVDAKIAELTPRGRAPAPQALLLAALALANDLEEERGQRDALERRTRDLLRRALLRIDDALDTDGERAEAH